MYTLEPGYELYMEHIDGKATTSSGAREVARESAARLRKFRLHSNELRKQWVVLSPFLNVEVFEQTHLCSFMAFYSV